MIKHTSKRVSSFRKKASMTMLIIVIPLFMAISLFVVFTMRNQHSAIRAARLSTLSAYQSQIESTVQTAESYLKNTIAGDTDFQTIVYAKTKTEAYVASEAVAETLTPLLNANALLGGFYTYSGQFDYYRANNLKSYPLKDAQLIREAVIQAAFSGDVLSDWTAIELSDRTVLLSVAVFQKTAAAAVIDLSNLSYSGLDEGGSVFSILPDGTAHAAALPFDPITPTTAEHTSFHDSYGNYYDSVILPLSSIPGYVLYAVPAQSPFQYLSIVQIFLLLVALFLLTSIPLYWMTFRRVLIEPLNSLTDTMRAIQSGNTEIHVPQQSQIQEVNEIAGTVNTMLDTLRKQKIEYYEQQLKTQQAQLQYLQLQIRPHFYLNCLNIIFSMAEEHNYTGIQEIVLDLSSYLRSMFRDTTKLVPLATELASVKSYIRIQQISALEKPKFKLELGSDVQEIMIPPLSILTFVENSFKHNKHEDKALDIHIKCDKIISEDGSWLNITVSDNCGGTSKTQLDQLNSAPEYMSRENSVGILNTKQRLHLLYGDQATLSFRNTTEGLCVDLFIPIE